MIRIGDTNVDLQEGNDGCISGWDEIKKKNWEKPGEAWRSKTEIIQFFRRCKKMECCKSLREES